MEINYKCPICGGNKFLKKFSSFDYVYNKRNKMYDIIECGNCKLKCIYPLPTKAEQFTFYPSDYYSYHMSDNSITLRNFLIKAERFVFSIFDNKKLKLPKENGDGKWFLDIGCGDGKNLKIMHQRGRNVNGFEIAENKSVKDNMFYGNSINDIDFKQKYDVIRCSQVLEHVDNPVEFLTKIKSILKDDGYLVISLPNTKSLSCKVFGKFDVSLDIPRHIFGYTLDNVQLLFEKIGFKVTFKQKRRQEGIAGAIAGAIVTKYNVNIRESIIYIFVLLLCVPVEFLLSCLKLTNSMGFVLKKGNN